MTAPHLHAVGPRSSGRREVADRHGARHRVSCHRRRRGPYSGGGELVRLVVPELLAVRPDAVRRRLIEVLTAAPELRGRVPAPPETLTSLAVPAERTRYYSRQRTLRIAHGLTELVRDWAAAVHPGGVVLALDDLQAADATDVELVSVLLRRLDPGQVRLVLGSTPDPLPDPLAGALDRYADRVAAPADLPAAGGPDLGSRFVATDGTSDDPELLAAYAAMPAGDRARAHDRRAEELERRPEAGVLVGAVPYHREHGSDPAGAGVRALTGAAATCLMHGFYPATVELGERILALADPEVDFAHHWAAVGRMTNALAALGRGREAETLYHHVRALSADPELHMGTAYALAMLYTRHHEEDRRDDEAAMEWINQSLAIAGLLPDPTKRAFNTVFAANGRALIEVHRRRLPEALRLVDGGLAQLDRELEPGEHLLHRSVLLYNRAQVHAGLGSLDAALRDYDAVIAVDPNYPEYHFDRAGLLRRLGRHEEALVEYDAAVRLSPPFLEVHYNRGDLLAELDDPAGAAAEFRYVLELDPDHVDALVNLVGLLQAAGEVAASAPLVEHGLGLDPANPHLLCARGELLAADGRWDDALGAYDEAIRRAPDLVAARVNRAVVAFLAGRPEDAVADLTVALRAGEDPDLRLNRGLALQAAGRHGEAVADFDRALGLEGGDEPELRYLRALSRRATGDQEGARADLEECRRLGGHPDEVGALLGQPDATAAAGTDAG